ncbi:UNVERIFIED_CONTAM: hypothetical protein Sradi_4430600 [Sesamum radiatum]|uniref:3'-5' exonuclease domain-containing protein n=1 Tax=Sesamum radiatum TaxID=300843 RepID=A0AAW2NRT4_SESRA
MCINGSLGLSVFTAPLFTANLSLASTRSGFLTLLLVIVVLQLCVGHHYLIVQLLHADGIPLSLYAFLADPRHVFCGVGVQEDMMKLYDHHGLTVVNTADLNELARLAGEADGTEYNHMGLKKMVAVILGKAMMKPLRVMLSKWDSHNLDFEQVEHAAINTFVSF